MATRINWTSVFFAYSTLFVFGLCDNLRGPLYPEVLQDLSLSDTQGSWFWAIASTLALVASSLSGQLSRLARPEILLNWGLVIMAAGQFVIGISGQYYGLLVGAAIYGISVGLTGVFQNVLILRAAPLEQTSRLQAGLHSNYAGASLLAPLVLNLLAPVLPGWRNGYHFGAGICLLLLAGLVFLKTEKNAEVAELAVAQKVDAHKDWTGIYLVGLALGMYVAVEIMVASRLSLFLRRELLFDYQQSNYATTLFFVGLFAGRLAFVFWKPRGSVRSWLVLSLLLTFLLMLAGLLVEPRLLVLTGITMSVFFPLLITYIGERFPAHLTSATAVAFALDSFAVIAMHGFVGTLTESFGIRVALWCGPAMLAVGVLLLFLDFRKLKT